VADSVALTGENRTMTRLGLDGLRRPVNGGLKALMEISGLAGKERALTAGATWGSVWGRASNAAGRMDVAGDVIELFTSRSAETLPGDRGRS